MAKHSEKRQMNHILSVRTDDATLAAIQEYAEADDISPSHWVRRAIAAAIWDRQKPPEIPAVPGYHVTGWQCEHLSMTGPAGVLGRPSAWCGCEMQPIYEQAA